MITRRRIGLLGGTFDPVHIAHLHIASCAMHDLMLDEVRFIPAGSPPHKPGVPVTPAPQRLRMLKIATEGTAAFVVDPIDLDTERPSYTSELLTRIRGDHPGDNLWFIIGGDSLAEFHTWHAPERILELARIAVAARPGWDLQEALSISPVRDLRQSVDVFSSVPIDLSATTIRHRLRDGRPVDWLVPSGVLDHIEAEGLYKEPRAETR